jgi:2-keto-3-deoxy-L-rhamnonate aldolase RhmA
VVEGVDVLLIHPADLEDDWDALTEEPRNDE